MQPVTRKTKQPTAQLSCAIGNTHNKTTAGSTGFRCYRQFACFMMFYYP